jgi:hypothetical protein
VLPSWPLQLKRDLSSKATCRTCWDHVAKFKKMTPEAKDKCKKSLEATRKRREDCS